MAKNTPTIAMLIERSENRLAKHKRIIADKKREITYRKNSIKAYENKIVLEEAYLAALKRKQKL
jgi:hypothetical protein